MFGYDFMRFMYKLAHAASDGHVSQSEILDALTEIFPDRVDRVLEQVKKEVDEGGSIGVDDVLQITAAFRK